MKRIVLISVIGMLLLTGCSENRHNVEQSNITKEEITVSKGLFDENGCSEEEIRLGFGYIENNDGLRVVFENESNEIKTRLFFETGEYDLEAGILVFVDGILQPVSVNGAEKKSLNVFSVNQRTEYDISFDLVSGEKDEKVRVDTISLLNPNFMPTGNTKGFGLCFATSSPLAAQAECKETVEAEKGASSFEYTELSDSVKEKYIITKADGTVVNNLERSMNIQYFQEDKEVSILEVSGHTLEFDMDIYGGEWENYNVYVFLNNEVLSCFEGKEYNTVVITPDKTTNISAKADVSDLALQEYNQLFVVAVPVGEIKDSDVYVSKLANIVVHNSKEGQ